MQDNSVERLFEEQLEHYSKTASSALRSPLIKLFSKWVKARKIKKTLKIAEFGGAAGQLLIELNKKYLNSQLTNIEIVQSYQKKQISRKIKFIKGTIIKSELPSKSFDVLIIRDVLHHLVGKNLAETRLNQQKALKELKRLVKPGGIILVEELINQSLWAGKFIYYLCKLNTFLKIRIDKLEISPETQIALFNGKTLTETFEKIFPKKAIICSQFIENKNIKGRLVHLGAPYGKMIYQIQA
jgi:ubiquinone/menaquinone biosynthesis C-methylase UbiE